MKKFSIKNFIVIFLFIVIIAVPMFIWDAITIVSFDEPQIMREIDFDLGEKRNKATISQIVDIETLAVELEKYYNDHIPFRSLIISFKHKIDTMVETPYVNVIEPFLLGSMSGKSQVEKNVEIKADMLSGKYKYYMDEAVAMFRGYKLKPNEFDPYNSNIVYPVKYLNQSVIIGQSNWTFLNYDNMKYYTGKNNIKEKDFDKYLAPYKKMNELCKKMNKQLAIIVCPEKEEVYGEYMPTMEIVDETEKAIKVRDYIATHSELGLTYIYPKEVLLDSKNDFRAYLKYDSHWSEAGGYFAVNELKKALGLPITPITDWELVKKPEERKDLLFLGGVDRDAYSDGIMYNILYKPDIKVETKYVDDVQMGTMAIYESTSPNKKVCFMIGDSYRYDLSTILMKDYSNYCCNSYLKIDDPTIKNEVKVADVIIIEAVERNMDVTIPMLLNRLYKYLTE